MPKPPITMAFLLQAIGPPGAGGGNPLAFRELYLQLRVVIHARVGRVLVRRAPSGRDPRQELDDMIGVVFVQLVKNDYHTLRQWDPARGMNLENYVGLIAERETGSILRGPRAPWSSQPTESEVLEQEPDPISSQEGRLAKQDVVKKIYDDTKRELSPLGRRMFELKWEQGLTVEEICLLENMTRGAVDAWMRRIRDLITKIARRYL